MFMCAHVYRTCVYSAEEPSIQITQKPKAFCTWDKISRLSAHTFGHLHKYNNKSRIFENMGRWSNIRSSAHILNICAVKYSKYLWKLVHICTNIRIQQRSSAQNIRISEYSDICADDFCCICADDRETKKKTWSSWEKIATGRVHVNEPSIYNTQEPYTLCKRAQISRSSA